MSGQNNDELAKLLAAMANGYTPDDTDAQQPASQAEAGTPASRPARIAVALPAPLSAAGTPQPLAPPILRPWGPSLFLKRTLIPILLTLGILCPTLGLMGYFVSETSPYAVLAETWFSIPFITIGVIMLGLAIVMMLLVRDELARQKR